jgi:hypothetical protein
MLKRKEVRSMARYPAKWMLECRLNERRTEMSRYTCYV